MKKAVFPDNLIGVLFCGKTSVKVNETGLEKAMLSLDERQKEILLMHYRDNTPYTEISRIMGITLNQTMGAASKAVRILRRRENRRLYDLQTMEPL